MIVKDSQKSLQVSLCVRMDKPKSFFTFQEIAQRLCMVIFIPQIIPGSTDSVHHHLGNIFTGHGNSVDNMFISRYVIYPIFKMMLVSSLMVKPGS